MSATVLASQDRRDAIKRATTAAVRLAVLPQLREQVRRHVGIVNGHGCTARLLYTDAEAWHSVHALELMVTTNGLATS